MSQTPQKMPWGPVLVLGGLRLRWLSPATLALSFGALALLRLL